MGYHSAVAKRLAICDPSGRLTAEVTPLADRLNQEFDARQPWVMAKDAAQAAQLQDACSRALQSGAQRGRTVTAIAFDYGFNSPTHFGRVFRAKFNVTPREYRREKIGHI